MSQPVFNATPEDFKTIVAIAVRYEGLVARTTGFPSARINTLMDIEACHCNDNPLDLAALLAANDFDFAHDVGGIHRYLDRSTGKLTSCFVPRFSQPRN